MNEGVYLPVDQKVVSMQQQVSGKPPTTNVYHQVKIIILIIFLNIFISMKLI